MAGSMQAKVDQIKARRQLEEEVEHSQASLAEVSGVPGQIRKRPIMKPISTYFLSKGAGPAKYPLNSDFQRRAELDMAIYMVTSNLSFNHIATPQFNRFGQ